MSSSEPAPPPAPTEISALTDHLFRHEAGKLVSVLTRLFGIERLALAEDVVQEALVRALQTWPYHGIPANPAAWLTQTAKNLALDLIRRESRFRDKQSQIIVSFEQWAGDGASPDALPSEGEIKNECLRLMFACCHPLIPADDRTALALKTLCGFSPAEIARAFLTTEVAITKRLTRARQKIRELRIRFEIPAGDELAPRLDSVLQTLYLLFNEGYKASTGEHLVRAELCAEAIRLATLVAEHPAGRQPHTHALLALMLLNAARLPARTDADGNLVRLEDQDRSRWDTALISRGLAHLGESAAGDTLSAYHLQAAIAACHCTAADFASTDWPRILAYYDQLVRIDDSPIVVLNRAVAVAQVHGPGAGIEAVGAVRHRRELAAYPLLHAVLGEFETQAGNYDSAVLHLKKALDLTTLKSERTHLTRQLKACEARLSASRHRS